MKYLLLLFLLIGAFNVCYAEKYQLKKEGKFPPSICYASDNVAKTYVAPPFELINQLKSAGAKSSQIVVIYDDAFKADIPAMNAFQYAVDIWKGLIYTPIPIYIYAYWYDKFEDNGTLGSCGPWDYFENFNEAPIKNTFYPGPIVEKMTGVEISDKSTPDLLARFNSERTDWYFGTDGKTPTTKYDFATVVLHEIGHGLGYTGFFEKDGTEAKYGGSFKHPGIFDRYVVNATKHYLIDTTRFKNPSASLLAELQSGSLFFNGKIAFDDAGLLEYPRLYSPVAWDEGSSVYHLNENSYPAGNINSLMTPYAAKAEANYNPGPMSLGMLNEMGWKFIQMKHEEHPDIEKAEDLKPIELCVESDYDLDLSKLFLISSKDKFVKADTVLMKATAKASYFTGSLNITQEGIIEYYFSAKDARNRTFRLPGIAPEKKYSVTYGKDDTPPTLIHEKIALMRQETLSVEMIARVRDNLGVGKVTVEYFVNKDVTAKTLTLVFDTLDYYQATLEFAKGSLLDGDSIRYKIVAEDNSVAKNKNQLPQQGYYKFYIEGTYLPVKQYFCDFNTANRDFSSADFTIKTYASFDNGALHTIHPYKSPEAADASYNYKAQLKYPIIIKNGGKIVYDEIVLVEPGEDGQKFGDPEFYDYVIVEGSKDNGKTWKYLIDGYDSGANSNWLNIYNNSIFGSNSSARGTKNLFLKREFFLNQKGNFQTGDTILIQFRLFSDPYGNGWGWCIDNLNIQDPNTSIASLAISPVELMFYPNPVTDKLVLQGSFSKPVGQIIVNLFNNAGQAVQSKQIEVNGRFLRETIEMEYLHSGIYFISIEFEDGQKINRKIVKK